MELKLVPLTKIWYSANPSMYTVNESFKHIFPWAELEGLLLPWEPWVKVRIILMQVVHVSEHQDTVIVDEVETMSCIFEIACFLIEVPLLIWVALNKLFQVAVNTWIVWKMGVAHPSFIFASED
jgi:hypothetical protein